MTDTADTALIARAKRDTYDWRLGKHPAIVDELANRLAALAQEVEAAEEAAQADLDTIEAKTIERCAATADVMGSLQSTDRLCRFGAEIAAAIRALAKEGE